MRGWLGCTLCRGEGKYLEEGDAHRSAGVVPCHNKRPVMSPKTRAALESSIKKWRANTRSTKPETYQVMSDTCALCKLQVNPEGELDCTGCPVMLSTGRGNCGGTPWIYTLRARNHWVAVHNKHLAPGQVPTRLQRAMVKVARDLARGRARDMVEFLEGLRDA